MLIAEICALIIVVFGLLCCRAFENASWDLQKKLITGIEVC
jgi:hypothetical protein